MRTIQVDVHLYGPLARYSGKEGSRIHSQLEINLAAGKRMHDLLEYLGIPMEERGITFINGILCALPGIQSDLNHILKDGDRVAFFHQKSMWPFQYRDGAAVTSELEEDLHKINRSFHHRSP
jgi:molybdopterin converting factor small subunit